MSQRRPTPDEVGRAEGQLAPLLRAMEAAQQRQASVSALLAMIAACAVLWSAMAILLAGLSRGGVLQRLFGVALLTRDGQPVSRPRAIARSAAGWSPLWLGGLLGLLWPAQAWAILSGAGVVAVTLWGATVVGALRDPARGPLDRLAGTWVVPR